MKSRLEIPFIQRTPFLSSAKTSIILIFYQTVAPTGQAFFEKFFGGFTMYTMREVCKETGMTYEGLKFYYNQGLVPNVKRDGIDPTEANGTYSAVL
jgi:hypothetical protein